MNIFDIATDKAQQIFDIATDKTHFSSKKMLISFLFLDENISCGSSLEAPR